MSRGPAIVWFSQDLRTADHEPLMAACQSDRPVIPLYIFDEQAEDDWPPGGAQRVYLHHSLKALDEQLRNLGSRLILRHGSTENHLLDIVRKTKAHAVYYHDRYEPAAVRLQENIEQALADEGIDAHGYAGYILHEPDAIRTKADDPYKVFSPFWKAFEKQVDVPRPIDAPKHIPTPESWPGGAALDDLNLLPRRDWDKPIADYWHCGEKAAGERIAWFTKNAAENYKQNRDFPAGRHTSEISPALHFGEISPRHLWHAVDNSYAYRREIGWREFSYHLICHFPQTPTEELHQKFKAFPWRDDMRTIKTELQAWQRGQTGYPIVDAGMRQLYEIGWMHNRLRMIVASFLTKDLMIYWHHGARWFWDTLVDADLGNNTQGWQWAAGCGADAQPFFRIFNPVSQGERFDPDGTFVRRWVPELKDMPNKFIHKPWDAPPQVLREAHIELGQTYPQRIVDHREARDRALAAFEKIKNQS